MANKKGGNVENYLGKSMTFDLYRDRLDHLVESGGTTGADISESHINYTKINRQRMARLDKTIVLDEAVKHAVRDNRRRMYWLIITESWCGDAAQNIPVIEKIAAESDIIETRYILRDENPDLMDQFLENGARSIPKLIALDAASLEVLGTWGSRPARLKEYFLRLKEQGLEKEQIGELLQRWYNDDKGRSVQDEFSDLIGTWDMRTAAVAIF